VVAVKVVRAVERYTDSAKIEAKILCDIKKEGGCQNFIVDLKDFFTHSEGNVSNTCLVFEPLGKSLYDLKQIVTKVLKSDSCARLRINHLKR
jgi:hypothetical protein